MGSDTISGSTTKRVSDPIFAMQEIRDEIAESAKVIKAAKIKL
jgi:hypothetical protein